MCMHVCREIHIFVLFKIFLGTTFQNNPFSGNVGVSTYQASDRFLVHVEAVVVTCYGEQFLDSTHHYYYNCLLFLIYNELMIVVNCLFRVW